MNETVMALDQRRAIKEAQLRANNERVMAVRMTIGGWAAQLLSGKLTPSPAEMELAAGKALDLWLIVNQIADKRAEAMHAKIESESKQTIATP